MWFFYDNNAFKVNKFIFIILKFIVDKGRAFSLSFRFFSTGSFFSDLLDLPPPSKSPSSEEVRLGGPAVSS